MTKSGGAVDIEPGRYARHSLVDWFDQDQVAAVRALVVGAGAIGNEVLKNLALLGVRHMAIVDLDHIAIHNLTRSVLFRESDVGRSKAEVAAERVRDLLPEAAPSVLGGPVETSLYPSLVKQHDVVFSCLDNFEARLALDEMCQLARVNVVSGAIDARYASVESYPYKAGLKCGCYSCNLPAGAFQRIAQRYSCGWLRRVGLVERKVPTTIITSSLVASMMVSWGLRLGRSEDGPTPTSRRLLTDTFTGLGSASELLRSDACPSCSQVQNHVEMLAWNESLDLGTGAAARLLRGRMPTEVVFSAECAACGFDASGSVRPGSKVRGHSTEARTCPSCRGDSVVIHARDYATLAELVALRGGRGPDVPYVLVDIGRTTFCLEIENE
jgi:molybdopterin-synthase adenylyltransferase